MKSGGEVGSWHPFQYEVKARQEHVWWRCALLAGTACVVWCLFFILRTAADNLVRPPNQEAVARPTLQVKN